jgi:hypothetical protein
MAQTFEEASAIVLAQNPGVTATEARRLALDLVSKSKLMEYIRRIQ